MEWYPKLCCNLKAPKAKKSVFPVPPESRVRGGLHTIKLLASSTIVARAIWTVTLYNTFPNVSIKHNRAALESPNIVWQLRPSRTRPLSPMLSRLRRTRSSVPERKLKGWPQHHGGLFFFFFFFQNCTICWGSSESAGHFNCIPCPHSNSDHCVEA